MRPRPGRHPEAGAAGPRIPGPRLPGPRAAGDDGSRRSFHVVLRAANANTTSLTLGTQVVPLDGKSNLLLRYRGRKNTFPYVSAADVLAGATAPDAFTGKVVFVGATALGTQELVATPFESVVRRRRSAGHGRGQPAARRLSPASRAQRRSSGVYHHRSRTLVRRSSSGVWVSFGERSPRSRGWVSCGPFPRG